MRMLWKWMVLYGIYREDGGNGITFVHMLYIDHNPNKCGIVHNISVLHIPIRRIWFIIMMAWSFVDNVGFTCVLKW